MASTRRVVVPVGGFSGRMPRMLLASGLPVWADSVHAAGVATKKHKKRLLVGNGRVKEVNRRIRLARTKWDAHENGACRRERERALELYETLTPEEKERVPQVLRVWLRYRSEKYFGEGRKGNGAKG